MTRLLDWTFNILAAASLLLCLATVGLWVRSYWVCDQFVAVRRHVSDDFIPHTSLMAESYRGQFTGDIYWHGGPEPDRAWIWELKLGRQTLPKAIAHPSYWLDSYAFHSWRWGVPAWSVVSAFAVLPAVVAFRQVRGVRRRRRRSRLGLCPACGYDLRATPGRCPECGPVPAATPSTS